MAIIYAMARYLGFAGCCVVLLLFYYEGIPGASRVPFLSSVPILGDLTTGKVHSYAAQQVALATKGMVTKFERDTLAAQLDEERRRAQQAAQITEEYRKRTEAAQIATAHAQDKLEKIIAEDNDTGGCGWSDGDLDWLRNHR